MKIISFIIICYLAISAVSACAQIVPPIHKSKQILDLSMVIKDRSQQLEIYPALRARPESIGSGQIGYKLNNVEVNAPINNKHLGVVFNHTLQAQGFITGEITFKIKGGGEPVGFDPANYPGFVKLTSPNIYEVVASTPSEFIQLFNRLKSRNDLEWVEPVVIYGITLNSKSN